MGIEESLEGRNKKGAFLKLVTTVGNKAHCRPSEGCVTEKGSFIHRCMKGVCPPEHSTHPHTGCGCWAGSCRLPTQSHCWVG